jgi:vacuolar-type H+-ATPase subunit I/STV1
MELNMYDLAEQLKQLREKKKDVEQRVKDINTEIDKTEYALVQVMAETETQNFTRAGTMFSLTTKTRASAIAGHRDELFSALKENGFGDLVYETVNANSLSAFVKEQIAENQDTVPDWLNGLVNVYEQTSVSVRKSMK